MDMGRKGEDGDIILLLTKYSLPYISYGSVGLGYRLPDFLFQPLILNFTFLPVKLQLNLHYYTLNSMFTDNGKVLNVNSLDKLVLEGVGKDSCPEGPAHIPLTCNPSNKSFDVLPPQCFHTLNDEPNPEKL